MISYAAKALDLPARTYSFTHLAQSLFLPSYLSEGIHFHLSQTNPKHSFPRTEPFIISNRPLEEWGKLLGDVLTAGAILDHFLHNAQTVAITGRSYRLKDHAAIASKEDKNKNTKSKSDENSTAEPAS